MKKICVFAVALSLVVTSLAADYQKSVGLLVGNLTGFSYKHFITENLAIQSDLGIGILATAAGVGVTVHMDGMSASDFASLKGYTLSIYDFGINENVLYQQSIKGSNFSYVLGGGMSLGFASPYKMTYDGYSNWMVGTEKGNSEPMFKYGINGYVGIEYKMPDAPITFGADFRPGYGLLAVSHYSDGDLSESVQYHYFDWHLSVSMRYCF